MAYRSLLSVGLSALLFSEVTAGNIGRRHVKRGSPLDGTHSSDTLGEKVAVAFSNVLKSHSPNAGDGEQKQPVAVQIEDKAVEDFQQQLSPACEKRFTAMLQGKAPELSTFDTHSGEAEGKKQCSALKGKLCYTKAEVRESQDHPDGRKLAQTTEVEGHSCVPAECAETSDLTALAKFMRGQTANLMPGEAVAVSLHVDCSGSGGAVAMIDGEGNSAAPAATRSGATAMAPWVCTALLGAFAVLV